MSANWEKDLVCKEHINWVELGCALNIAKKGIAPLVQREIDTWYQNLLRANAGLSASCSCSGSEGGKCPRCVDWQRELKRLHRNRNPTLSNCNEKDWSNPIAGAWEVAKAYVSTLGNRKSDVTSAETTDLGGLVNILLMFKFLPSDKQRNDTARKVSDARNRWAHAPTHAITDKELGNMLGDIQALLTDPLFKIDADAKNALKDLQDMKREGIRNIKESELKQMVELRKTLNEELQDLLEALNLVKKCGCLQSEVDELKTSAQQTEDRISEVEEAITNFNDLIGRRSDLQIDINSIKLKIDVEDLKDDVRVLKNERQTSQKTEVLINFPQKLQSFTGRQKELQWLYDCFIKKLHDGEKSTSGTCGVISGLGGSGKTSLAVEFGCRHQALFPGGIFWINAESEVNIAKSVREILSPQLGIKEASKASNQEIVNHLLSHLHKQEFPWLLVLDNVDELDDSRCPDSLRLILKWPWQRGNGNMLLTSRINQREIQISLEQLHSNFWTLDCLSPGDATTFLVNNCKLGDTEIEEQTRKYAHELAQELGCLPLALKQATAYISVSPLKCSLESYLREYKRVKGAILKKKSTQAFKSVESTQSLSVHTTWIMNIQNIHNECPAAETMMKIAAFLGSDPVPVEVINSGEPEIGDAYKEFREKCRSVLGRSDILQTLTKFSLFSHDSENNVFGIHKLVQDVIRNDMGIEERKVIAFAAVAVLRKAPDVSEQQGKMQIRLLDNVYSSVTTLREHGKILKLPVLVDECKSLMTNLRLQVKTTYKLI